MIGETILHYKILEKLGEGGMGVVYKAHDTKLDRDVAIKFLPKRIASNADERQRFEIEAKAAAALNHPNIATIHNIEEHDDEMFIVMEYIGGQELGDIVGVQNLEPLPIKTIVDYATQIASALQAAHEKGVVHRDIKSANIMVTEKGQVHPVGHISYGVKIMDFGLAKLAGSDVRLTKEHTTLGTVAYMSPEQARGEEIDHRTDIWAFGVVLYEMLTGQLPFDGDYEQAVIYSILNEEPTPVSELRDDVSPELESIVAKALAKDTDARYQHVDEMRVDLQAVQNSHSKTQAGTPNTQTSRKKTGVLAGAFAVVVLLAVAAAVYFTKDDSAPLVGIERKMLVVLPFENLGAPEDAYFADELTNEITNRLSHLSGLDVISGNTARRFKGTDKSNNEIGKELGVDFILTGKVNWRRAAELTGDVRITPQLIRVIDDTQVWTEPFQQKIDKIFEIQTNIAEEVAKKLDIEILLPERENFQRRPTNNLAAYDLYLQGTSLSNQSFSRAESEGYSLAIPLFEQAIALDPHFVLAFVALSWSHQQIYVLGVDRSDKRLAAAEAAATEALRLQPDSPDAHRALGNYYYNCIQDFASALKAFDNLRKLLPNISPALRALSLRRMGEWREALEEYKRGFALSPREAWIPFGIASSYMRLRRFAEAEKWYNQSLTVDPSFQAARNYKARNHLWWKGDVEGAEAILAPAPKNQPLYNSWHWLNQADADHSRVLDRLAQIESDVIIHQSRHIPKSLAYATAHYMAREPEKITSLADSARVKLEAEIRKQPSDSRLYSSLGLAYAFLGSKEDAIQTAKRAVEITPVSKDALTGPVYVLSLAEVYAVVGEHDLAIDQLEYLLTIPSEMSASWLRFDRFWHALREHPRFQKLIADGDKPL